MARLGNTGVKKVLNTNALKRTSQGIKHKPKGKNARRHWKAYRGQGRP